LQNVVLLTFLWFHNELELLLLQRLLFVLCLFEPPDLGHLFLQVLEVHRCYLLTIIISSLLICSLQPNANIGNLRFNTPKHLSTTLRVRIWLSLYSCSAGVLGRSSGVNKKLVLA
jgi:hypothetical protein